MASWPLSKACPRCKVVGHDSQTCPKCPSAKRSSSSRTKKSSSSAPSSSSTPAADAAPPDSSALTQASTSATVAVAALASDPLSSVDTPTATPADVDMANASTPSTPLSTPSTSTAIPSGPAQMHQKDLAYLSPSQLSSLSKSVAPKYIDFDIYMKLSSEQQDAMPSFIQINTDKPVAVSMRRTRSKEQKKK